MPTTLPAMQHSMPPLDHARSDLNTNNLDIPLAIAPSPSAAPLPARRGWLRALLPRMAAPRGHRLGGIQKSMLNELAQVASTPVHETLARQIVETDDAEILWSLRHALAEAIGDVHGDVVARQKMTEISFMFAGLLKRRAVHQEEPAGENVVRLQPRTQKPGISA